MGWLFGRRRESQDVNDVLRRHNEAEAERLAALSSGSSAAVRAGAPVTAATSSAEFAVEDVFRITGRGLVATGHVTSGLFREGDPLHVVRDGTTLATTRLTGIEMFRRRATEAAIGEMAGFLLEGKVEIARGDVIRAAGAS